LFTDAFLTSLLTDYLKFKQPVKGLSTAKPPSKPTHQATLTSLVNDCLDKLVTTFQLKLLNHYFLSRVMKYLPSAMRDNETFLRCLCLYTVPEVFHKALSEVQTRRAKLVDRGIMNMVQSLFK
jgi:hypothetical protein